MITNSQPDLKQRVLAAARRVPSGVRADARSDARTIFLSAVAVSLGLFLACGGVSHSAGRPPWFLATSLAIWAAVAVTSARGAWRWGGSFVPGSALQLTTIALGTPALLLAASLALARLSPASVRAGAAAGRLPCLALTFAAALYPLAALSVLRRSTDPLHPIAGGAALGAASGAAAGVMVDLWCPVTEASHILSAHVLPVAALTVLGAILGDRILAMRVAAAVRARPTTASRAPPGPRSGAWPDPRSGSSESRERSGKNGRKKRKEAVIAKPFVSCDVAPLGDRVAGCRPRSMRIGGDDGAGGGGRHDP